jgi:hypothetical protein
MDLKGQFMQDINAISYAWTPEAAVILKNLFFLKWEGHANPQVRDATAHFKTEWCNERVGNWSCGHSHNSVMNTNGLEATNKVIKDELTFRQLMPVLDFLQKALLWLREQSERRDEGPEGARNPNVLKFALQHTFITLDWTEAYSWKVNTRKQIIFLPEVNIFVAAAPGARGDLDEIKALAFVNTFTNCSWATYDEYTSMHSNISILRSDPTRPELYNCTCANNAKKFTCVHSLGVAIMRGILVAPRAAQVQLLGRKRRRGRRPMAAPAWERMEFEIQTPVQHPQQDNAILLGPPVADIAADLIAE